MLIEGYPSKSSEPGGLHMDQYLRPPKSQSMWYGIHRAEPKDSTRPGRYVTPWPNDAAKLNSIFVRIAKPSVTSSQPPSPEGSFACTQEGSREVKGSDLSRPFQQIVHCPQTKSEMAAKLGPQYSKPIFVCENRPRRQFKSPCNKGNG